MGPLITPLDNGHHEGKERRDGERKDEDQANGRQADPLRFVAHEAADYPRQDPE
jgi:hypothetical protein